MVSPIKPKNKYYGVNNIKDKRITLFYNEVLKEKGNTLVGLCPFHEERTPSFTIYKESNSYFCFGCGAGGTVIDFYMQLHDVDFKTAIKEMNDSI